MQIPNTNRYTANCLNCVAVKRHVMSPRHLTNLSNWLDCPYFIICLHYRNQNGLIRNRSLHIIWVNHPISINRQVSNLETFFF